MLGTGVPETCGAASKRAAGTAALAGSAGAVLRCRYAIVSGSRRNACATPGAETGGPAGAGFGG